jgi:hypothetical protein
MPAETDGASKLIVKARRRIGTVHRHADRAGLRNSDGARRTATPSPAHT